MINGNPATLRKALEFAHAMAKAGVEFVVIPVIDEDHRNELADQLRRSLDHMQNEYDTNQD